MKKLSELAQGAHFLYGGVEWVKFEDIGAGTLCLAAEPVFLRAFDEENCNDWRKSSFAPGTEWGVPSTRWLRRAQTGPRSSIGKAT